METKNKQKEWFESRQRQKAASQLGQNYRIREEKELQGHIKAWKSDEKRESFLAMDKYIEKKSIDEALKTFRSEGRKIEGVHYLNGDIDAKVLTNGINHIEVYFEFRVQPIEVIIKEEQKRKDKALINFLKGSYE